jgi:LmbE family N-acetylglucosaminyl deacetylase
MTFMRARFCLLILIMSIIAPAMRTPAAEVAEDRGAMGLDQALKRLDVVSSVLHTGAHPDDENSALLAWLSRGQGVRTGYVSATRGDGGQNLLGTELFEALGVIRTEELLAARRFDHAQQFFTPLYEFGFSKTADEGFEKWGHEQVLGDFVRVIRQFRPEIIVSRFSGTPGDGHGHHQVAGIITKEAFKAAADPARFPEYGKPWQAKKLYLNVGIGPQQAEQQAAALKQPGVTVNVGEYDLALGRSYNEIAAEGRSLHRSQSQGTAQEKGPRTTRLQLLDQAVDADPSAGLFEGTISKLTDLAQLESELSSDLNQLQRQVDTIRQKPAYTSSGDILPQLASAIRLLKQIQTKARNEQVQFLLSQKEPDFHEAARLAAGLVVDVIASDDTVSPGQEINLSIVVVNGGRHDFPTVRTHTDFPPGWQTDYQGSTGSLQSGQRFEQKFKVKIAPGAAFTQPYWLQQPRKDDRFVWLPGAPANMPFDPPLMDTRAEVDYEGATIAFSKPAEFRNIDSMYGELRSFVKVVPALSVRISPDVAVVPISSDRRKEFTVTIENQNPVAAESEVHLVTPQGWTVAPASRLVKLARQGEKASVQFVVSIPQVQGDFSIQAVAKLGNEEYKTGYAAITYPHIQTRHIYAPAASKVEVFDVKSSVTSIGYVEGAGDGVPDALRQLGINVTTLSAQDLASGDLSRFPTIVLGIRAYGVRNDVRAYNNRLLEYVSNGGTLIAQYNRSEEIRDNHFGPYPFTINNNDRVTKEEAAVKILQPAHPVFNTPNKITEKDFDGWVQERGTYFFRTWDPKYQPLLESHDPGEDPKEGGLMVARYGKGAYVYTGYVFFRELPAGVKGAYRLFANLVSLKLL